MGKYKLSKRSLGRLQDVDSVIIAILVDSIGHEDCPHDFGIPQHGGKRTASEQNLLYNQVPKVTNKDGYNKKSRHQSGEAFDIYAYVDGKATWSKKYYYSLAKHIKKVAKENYGVNLTWGGDWVRFKDYPHFQIDKKK